LLVNFRRFEVFDEHYLVLSHCERFRQSRIQAHKTFHFGSKWDQSILTCGSKYSYMWINVFLHV